MISKRRDALVELRIRFRHELLDVYDKKSADFLFNESSSCIDNVIASLVEHLQRDRAAERCQCYNAEAEFLRWCDDKP